jgi:stage II sporulation protein GA (sporulation sigma-E factor processing peptidase)
MYYILNLTSWIERRKPLTVYLDVIWFLNFCFDALLLLLTATLLKRPVFKWRIALAAFIGSTIVLFMFTPYHYFFSLPLVKIIYSLIMVLLAFGFTRLTTFMQNIFMFYLVTFMIGGGMLGIHNLFNVNWILKEGTFHIGDPVSWTFVIIGFPIVYYYSKKNMDHLEVRKVHYEQMVDVLITIENTNISLKGLVDSGNQLHDPISRAPVMIVDLANCRELLPATFVKRIEHPEMLGTAEDERLRCPWEGRMKVIPFRAVGNQQFLLAINPDEITIDDEEKSYKVRKGLVAFSTTKLSSDGEYGCIVHPKMIVLGQSIQTA